MFTEDHTFEEIKGKEPIGRALGNLFPSCWTSRIQEEHYGDTMAKIKEEDTMEWGQPFLSEALVESANLLEMAAEKKNFMFVPLWEKDGATAGWKEGIPDADLNCEEGVWLFTGNPAVDNMAFAHTAGEASVPPYPSEAAAQATKDVTEKRPAVILCPGGAYEMLSMYSEGIQLAQRMERDGGYKAFLLNYRIAPNCYPQSQMDLALAVMHVRVHAKEYGIDPERIVVVGSSAGGHLCASEAYLYGELKENILKEWKKRSKKTAAQYEKVTARPDGVALLYPVISFISEYHEGSYRNNTKEKPGLREKLSVEMHVTADYPSTYAFANEDDGCVPASNTKRLDEALAAAGVPHLCELYPTGDHGVGLAYGCSSRRWSEEMLNFFETVWKDHARLS